MSSGFSHFTTTGRTVLSGWPSYLTILVGATTVVFSVVMILFAIGLVRLRRNRTAAPVHWPSVSVIMPARNEADVLPWTLRSLMRQDYPGNWEVIVVDDRSNDNTAEVLAKLTRLYSNLRVIRIEDTLASSPKKRALAQGIASSESDVVFTTDADCQYDPQWLSSMVSQMSDDVGVVAGLTIFDLPDFRAVPVWQKVQWLDFFVQNFLAAGALGWGHAASCNGSNLCFRRKVFDEVSGYGKSAAIVSGDDVLFAQRVATETKWKMVFASNSESIVRSLPVETVRDLMHQRLRWASKGLTYRGSMLFFLFSIYVYYIALLALPAVAAFVPELRVPAIAIWGTKVLVDTTLIVTGARVFGQERLLPYFPAYEFLHVAFTPFFGIAGLLLPYHWKGGWYRTAKLPQGVAGRWLRFRERPTKAEERKAYVE